MTNTKKPCFIRKSENGIVWFVDDRFDNWSLGKFLSRLSVGNGPEQESGTLVQQRRGHRSWTDQEDKLQVFVKRYFPRNWQNGVTYLWRKNRAEKERDMYIRLREKNIPVPDLYAYTEVSVFGWWRYILLLYKYYSDFVSLKNSSQSIKNSDSVVRLAEQVALLHDSNIYFGDLHAGNILVNFDNHDRTVMFIDFDKVKIFSDLEETYWIDDLARLNGFVDTSINLRMVFLTAYCRYRKIRQVREVYLKINRQTEELWQSRSAKSITEERKYPKIPELQ